MSTDSIALTNQLNLLERADLLRRAQMQSELEYLFKHALLQESVYDTLLRNDRRRLHRLVAETFERELSQQEEHVPLLAMHWDKAGVPERAFGYYLRAGKNAARVYANMEALMAYDRASELSSELELSPEQAQRLYAGRGRVLELQGEYDAALANYQQQAAWAMEHANSDLELDALIRRTTLFTTPTKLLNFDKGVQLSQEALERARAAGNRAAEAKILWNLSLAHFFAEQNAEAIRYGEASAAIARELNMREQLAFTLNDIARPYIMAGRHAEGFAAMAEAEALWRELNNLPMLADNLIGIGMSSLFAGDYQSAREQVYEGLRISREIGNIWGESYALETLGFLYALSGEVNRALENLLTALQLGVEANYLDAQYTGVVVGSLLYQMLGVPEKARSLVAWSLARPDVAPGWLVVPNAMLAILHADQGDLESAQVSLERAESGYEGDLGFWGLILLLARIRVLLAQAHPDAALVEARNAVQQLVSNRLHPFRALFLYQEAVALEQLGKLDEAVQSAEAARRESEETASPTWFWEIGALLARLYAMRGDVARAQETRQDALVQVQFLADHAPPEFRDSFLNRPEVRALLQNSR